MNTVVIINDFGFVNGGQAKVAIDTSLLLAKAGWNVIFFCGVGPVDERLESTGVRSVCLNQHDLFSNPDRKQAAIRGLWNREATRQLGSILQEVDPEDSVIHIHGWAKSLSPSIGRALAKSKIPQVYTLHEYFLACPNGGFYDRQRQEICTRRALSASCLITHCDQRQRSHKIWRVVRQAILWSAGAMPRALRDFIYLSETQLHAIRSYLPAGARMHCLPNPVEPPPPARIKAELNDVFLFIGRLSSEKGAELAARAARKASVRVAFAGNGECNDAILSANPDALMLGWLDAAALQDAMSRARCLIFPSLWYEGYPLVVIEAMRLGLPVLASDRTAAIEVVRHDVDGLHVPTGEQQAWVDAMQRMGDDHKVAGYSASSFERAHEFLGAEAYRERLLAIYRDAAHRQRLERRAGA